MSQFEYTLGIYDSITDYLPELRPDFDYLIDLYETGAETRDDHEEHVQNIITAATKLIEDGLKHFDETLEAAKVSVIRVSTYVTIALSVTTESDLSEEDYIESFVEEHEDWLGGVLG